MTLPQAQLGVVPRHAWIIQDDIVIERTADSDDRFDELHMPAAFQNQETLDMARAIQCVAGCVDFSGGDFDSLLNGLRVLGKVLRRDGDLFAWDALIRSDLYDRLVGHVQSGTRSQIDQGMGQIVWERRLRFTQSFIIGRAQIDPVYVGRASALATSMGCSCPPARRPNVPSTNCSAFDSNFVSLFKAASQSNLCRFHPTCLCSGVCQET